MADIKRFDFNKIAADLGYVAEGGPGGRPAGGPGGKPGGPGGKPGKAPISATRS